MRKSYLEIESLLVFPIVGAVVGRNVVIVTSEAVIKIHECRVQFKWWKRIDAQVQRMGRIKN